MCVFGLVLVNAGWVLGYELLGMHQEVFGLCIGEVLFVFPLSGGWGGG